MNNVLTMVRSDLRQRIRDGSVLAFAIVVPLSLMWVMNLVFGDATDPTLEPITVAVAVPLQDETAAVIPEVLGSVSDGGGLQIIVQEADPTEVPALVEDGTAGMGVVVPEGFSAALMAGDGPEVRVTLGDDTGLMGQIVNSIVQATLAQMTAATRAASAGLELGLPPDQLGDIAEAAVAQAPEVQWRQGQAASEQLGPQESLVAGQAGMFLLFTVGFGVLALVSERNQGTLARLLSMPMRPGLITVAKGIVSFILGLAATTVLLSAGSMMFDNVDFGSPVAVGVLILLVVAASTSIMFIIAKVARTAEQAGIAQSIVAVVLGMSGGAFFPIDSTGAVGTILALNPVKTFTDGLGITAGGGGVGDLGIIALTMAGFTTIALLIAWLLPDRKDAL